MTKSKYNNFGLDDLEKHIESVVKVNKKYHTYLDPSFSEGNRTHNVKINLTDKEYDNLVKTCKTMNMKKSEYFRTLMYYHGFVPMVNFDDVLQYNVVVDSMAQLVQRLSENNEALGHVGNNLNQFVHQLNSNKQMQNIDHLVDFLNNLQRIVSESHNANDRADNLTTTIWSSLMGGVNDGLDKSESTNESDQ